MRPPKLPFMRPHRKLFAARLGLFLCFVGSVTQTIRADNPNSTIGWAFAALLCGPLFAGLLLLGRHLEATWREEECARMAYLKETYKVHLSLHSAGEQGELSIVQEDNVKIRNQ